MDMRELELLVPTLFGLEGLCAEELRRLKLPEVAAENGRVRCKAAPLRETLAAAMVLLSRYRGRDPFCDPFCGSGTIAIEAALIAKNRAPGLNRAFSAQKWRWLDSACHTPCVRWR